MNEMAVSDYKGVFIFAQQVDNKITGVSYELIGKGKALAADLGTEVTAVLLGYQVGDLTKKLAKYGADRVIVVDDPALETYMTEPYAYAMTEVIKAHKPEVVLYEEELDPRTLTAAVDAISQADTLLIAGTSLAVYPAAGLIRYFEGDCLALVNLSPTPMDQKADLVIRGKIGEVLSRIQ